MTVPVTSLRTLACILCLLFPSLAQADLLLRARDPESLSRFYRAQLGLGAEEADAGATIFDLGGERLVIVGGGEANPRSNLRLFIQAEDLEAARRRLVAAGVEVEDARDEQGEVFGLLFHDPEGNPLGFLLPDVSPSFPAEWRTLLPARAESSGRVEFAIWSGLHGVGLGFALPYSLGSDSPTVIGLTMMAAGPVSAVAAYRYGRHARLTRGQARALENGGDFAMWQALGWSGVADADAERVLLWGTAGLVGGTVTTAFLTRGADIAAGQAGLFLSSASWASWFGLVGARIAAANRSVSDDATLATMLLASAGGGLAGGIAAMSTDLDESRLAWINLGGVLGTAFGFGLDLVLQLDDDSTVWAVPASTGLGALAFTTWATRKRHDARGFGRLLSGTGEGGVVWLTPSVQPAERGCRLELLRCRF